MKQVKSCGLIIFRENKDTNRKEFLLMKHAHRFDLPKGHKEQGESDIQTALREVREETGLNTDALVVDTDFVYEETYYPFYKRFKEKVAKTICVFLAVMKDPSTAIVATEHPSYAWIEWQPPHKLQSSTIDSLLQKVQQYFMENSEKIHNLFATS